MRAYAWTSMLITLAGAASALSASACSNREGNCVLNANCGGGAGTDTGGSGGSGGSGGAPPECIPRVGSAAVDDTCGVFVSAAGKDTNEGSKDKPFATLAKALDVAKGSPVYACTDGFTEAVTLKSDATIYGGLDCKKGWKYVGDTTKTPWTAAADALPLRIAAGARARLEDVALTAADAKESGGSSIAVLAELGTQLALARCVVSAGNGADGAAGDPPNGAGMQGEAGKDGSGSCTSDMGEFGGSGGQLTCEAANVFGGDGGNGTKSVIGGDGSGGQPIGDMGKGGLGQTASSCVAGGDGALGIPGSPGLGAPMSSGTIGPDGYAGVAGEDGKPGLPGQGGGGGGGGKGCANMKAGPSGGGGGSGACGGAGGKGGKPGGSSIGIVSLGAKLTLDTTKISAKNGGKGGKGADGQPGGTGGSGGMPGATEVGGNSATACFGGKGGDGGMGGKGGGGLGGHSIGIAHAGDAPDTKGATITTGGTGQGGIGDGAIGTGAAGVAKGVLGF